MGKGPRWIVRRNNPILNVPAILGIPNTVNRVLSRGIIYGDELFRKDDRYCSCFEVVSDGTPIYPLCAPLIPGTHKEWR